MKQIVDIVTERDDEKGILKITITYKVPQMTIDELIKFIEELGLITPSDRRLTD